MSGNRKEDTELTCSQEDSRAKILAKLGIMVKGLMGQNQDSGSNTTGLSKYFAPVGWLSKTQQLLGMQEGVSGPYCPTFMNAGTMHNGLLFDRAFVERPIEEPDYGWLPTPTTKANQTCHSMQKHRSCRTFIKIFGTGPIHPEIYEWMMGFPRGWTEIDASETP